MNSPKVFPKSESTVLHVHTAHVRRRNDATRVAAARLRLSRRGRGVLLRRAQRPLQGTWGDHDAPQPSGESANPKPVVKSVALEVFLKFFNNKNDLFAFFIKLIT